MAIAGATTPFGQAHYQVSPTIELTLLAPFEAGQAGVLCASMDPWARYRTTAGELTAFFARTEPGAPRFAIRVNGQLEGVLVLKSNWLAGPYIQTFALARLAQGQGTGSLILGFIDAQARAARNRNVWVAASDFNAAALRFYERHGFVRTAEIPGLLQDGRDEILLRKRVTA